LLIFEQIRNLLRHYLSILFLFIAVLPGVAQETLPSKLEWYQSYFDVKEPLENPERERLDLKLKEAIELNDKGSEAHVRKEIGLILLTRVPDYGRALDYIISAFHIEDSLGLSQDVIISYIAMARVFAETGDHHKSGELLTTAEQVNENYKDRDILVYILNEKGKNNAALGFFDDALENYEVALKYLGAGDPIEADILFNMGHMYSLRKENAKALDKHKAALKLWRKYGNRTREAHSLNDIGQLYQLMKNPVKAIDNFQVAVEIRTSLKDNAGLAESYNNLGVLYFEQKSYDKAIASLQKGLDAASGEQLAEERARSTEYLKYCYKELKDFERALYYAESSAQLSEMVGAEKSSEEPLAKQSRFELNQREAQINEMEINQRQREEKIANQRKLTNFLFAVVGLGLVVALLTFYLYMVKRRANISLRSAQAKLNLQNAELQNLNATKDKFFSIISHDLKGPLNSFTAFSKMLIDHTDSMTKEEIQMLAREIDKNLKNVFALLENLLEWSRSQTGNIEFKPEAFDLNDILRQNKELLTAQASTKGITIQYSNPGPLLVHAHQHSINTVVRNLISNAIKFTPAGGTIFLDAKPQMGMLRVSVTDTGVGMSAAVVAKLFRIDTKYSTSGTANEKGTGLGLILCKDFIEKNGGNIGVESTEGKGSVFFFTLPQVQTGGYQLKQPAVKEKSVLAQ
jgi:signal transduction histidine kinase